MVLHEWITYKGIFLRYDIKIKQLTYIESKILFLKIQKEVQEFYKLTELKK